MATSSNKVLSALGPCKKGQQGRGRRKAKGLKELRLVGKRGRGRVVPKSKGRRMVEPETHRTGSRPQDGGGGRSRRKSW